MCVDKLLRRFLLRNGCVGADNGVCVVDNLEALRSAGERRYSTLEASNVTWPEACESGRAKNIRRRGCGSDARHTENGRTLLTQRLADRNRARQSEHPAFRTLTAWQRGNFDHHRGRRSYV